MPHVPKPGNGIVVVPGEGVFDLVTTQALWADFKGPASLGKRELWVDRPSAGIPYLYVRTGIVLSAALAQAGLKDQAASVRAQVERIAHATQLDDVLASIAR
jgi:hypothetical protein